jgi:hypothetical protein
MEQWEHVAVEGFVGDDQKLVMIEAGGKITVLDAEEASTGRALTTLNELGSNGWQLVSTETHEFKDGRGRTYWLRRLVQ